MSDNQVIPDAAVEAAWATIWDVPSLPTCDITRSELRAALEAAAPHIGNVAYDAGFNDGQDEMATYDNPYASKS